MRPKAKSSTTVKTKARKRVRKTPEPQEPKTYCPFCGRTDLRGPKFSQHLEVHAEEQNENYALIEDGMEDFETGVRAYRGVVKAATKSAIQINELYRMETLPDERVNKPVKRKQRVYWDARQQRLLPK